MGEVFPLIYLGDKIKMSSFIVEDKTINRVLSWLYNLNSNDYNKTRLYDLFKKYDLGSYKDKNFKKLGTDMLRLNYEAVNFRYEENNKHIAFKFKEEKTDIVQILKSVQCFLYQCNEGNIPKRKLFKNLKTTEEILKNLIISKHTDYEKKDWG